MLIKKYIDNLLVYSDGNNVNKNKTELKILKDGKYSFSSKDKIFRTNPAKLTLSIDTDETTYTLSLNMHDNNIIEKLEKDIAKKCNDTIENNSWYKENCMGILETLAAWKKFGYFEIASISRGKKSGLKEISPNVQLLPDEIKELRSPIVQAVSAFPGLEAPFRENKYYFDMINQNFKDGKICYKKISYAIM